MYSLEIKMAENKQEVMHSDTGAIHGMLGLGLLLPFKREIGGL